MYCNRSGRKFRSIFHTFLGEWNENLPLLGYDNICLLLTFSERMNLVLCMYAKLHFYPFSYHKTNNYKFTEFGTFYRLFSIWSFKDQAWASENPVWHCLRIIRRVPFSNLGEALKNLVGLIKSTSWRKKTEYYGLVQIFDIRLNAANK